MGDSVLHSHLDWQFRVLFYNWLDWQARQYL